MTKDIWTMCLTCKMAFLAKSADAPMCGLCLEETKDRVHYEKSKSWREEPTNGK